MRKKHEFLCETRKNFKNTNIGGNRGKPKRVVLNMFGEKRYTWYTLLEILGIF